MNRRGFLEGLITAVPLVICGEELAELLAPRKTFWLPPPGGWITRQWSVNSLGGYYYSRQLAEALRANVHVQPLLRFKQFADVAPLSRRTWDVFGE